MKEVGQDLFAPWGVGHLRVELETVDVFPANHGVRAVFRGGHGFETLGQASDSIPVAVPDLEVLGKAGKKGAGPAAMKRATPVLASGATGHLAPKLFHQKLHPVTDTQDGNAQMENAAIHLGRLRGVNAGWATAKDDSLGPEGEDFPNGDGVRDDLGIDVGFADPAGDDLGVLGTEIKNQDPFLDSVGTR